MAHPPHSYHVSFSPAFGQTSHELVLLELTDDIQRSLEEGRDVFIKGDPAADGDAVLCTDDKTYELRINETSNPKFLAVPCEPPPGPIPPTVPQADCTETLPMASGTTPMDVDPPQGAAAAAAGAEEAQKGDGDGGVEERGLIIMSKCLSEISPIPTVPRVTQVGRVLQQIKLQGQQLDEGDQEGRARLRRRSTTAALAYDVQASRSQLEAYLAAQNNLVEIEGEWRVIDEDHVYSTIDLTLSHVTAGRFPADAIPLHDLCDALKDTDDDTQGADKGQFDTSPEVVHKILTPYLIPPPLLQPPSSNPTLALDRTQVQRFIGLNVLYTNKKSGEEHLTTEAFKQRWRQKMGPWTNEQQQEGASRGGGGGVATSPSGWSQGRSSGSIERDGADWEGLPIDLLSGQYYLLFEEQQLPVVVYMDEKALAIDPKQRLQAMIDVKSVWTRRELHGYLSPVLPPHTKLDSFIMDNTRPTDITVVLREEKDEAGNSVQETVVVKAYTSKLLTKRDMDARKKALAESRKAREQEYLYS